MNTRFTPTLSSGKIHIGHLVNLLLNLLAARRSGGRMVVVADNAQLDLTLIKPDQDALRSNREVLTTLLPGRPTYWYFQNNDALVRRMLEDRLGERRVADLPVYGWHFYVIALDYLLGVDTLIRGEDWKQEIYNEISAFCLGLMRGSEVAVHYHALVTADGRKISKSDGAERYALERLLVEVKVHRAALLLYAANMIDPTVDTLDHLVHFAERFDLRAACDVRPDYREERLLALHRDLARRHGEAGLDRFYTNWVGN